jgi:DNA-binding NtrC family response regulator
MAEIIGESAAIDRARELIAVSPCSVRRSQLRAYSASPGRERVLRTSTKAFTGASRDRVGLLAQAHSGSLFLDELMCFSSAHQAKLLRVLDDGQIRKVGAQSSRVVAVRFLAATNKSPQDLLARGEVRRKLFYRLGSLEILLPPLRERGAASRAPSSQL